MVLLSAHGALMSPDNHLPSWRLSTDSCTASFLEGKSVTTLASWKQLEFGESGSFVCPGRPGRRNVDLLLCLGVYACMFGIGREACSHSHMPLKMLEAAMSDPLSVTLTSSLAPDNYPTNPPSRMRPEVQGRLSAEKMNATQPFAQHGT